MVCREIFCSIQAGGFARSKRPEPKNFAAGVFGSGSRIDTKSFTKLGFLSECIDPTSLILLVDAYVDPYKIQNKFRTTNNEKIKSAHGNRAFKSGTKQEG